MKKLLFSLTKKDFRVDTFRAGGPGGQHQNKTDSAVRITHMASGAVGESREERSQHANKQIAFKRLAGSGRFRAWVARRAHEIESEETVEQAVERQMAPGSIRVDVQRDGRWGPEVNA